MLAGPCLLEALKENQLLCSQCWKDCVSCIYESKSPFLWWISFRRYSQLDHLSKPATANVILHDLNFSHVFLCIVLTTGGEISFERLIWLKLIYLDNLSCFLQHNLHSLNYMYEVNSVIEENICSFKGLELVHIWGETIFCLAYYPTSHIYKVTETNVNQVIWGNKTHILPTSSHYLSNMFN